MAKNVCRPVEDGAARPLSQSQNPRTLGPVSDLERHLPSDWWRDLFNSMYLKTDGDVVENQENTRQDVDMVLEHLAPATDARILDLCCGQGRHSLELARRGFGSVTGLDRSRYLVRLARKRARQNGLPVRFSEGDARTARPSKEPFDHVIVMGNSFGYFEQAEDDVAVLGNLFASMNPGGSLLMDLTDGAWMREHYERRSWEWIDQSHFVCRERGLSEDCRRLVTREVISHADKGVLVDQFYAERLYAADEIMDLIRSVGYVDVALHKPPRVISTRDQDLGMLAHRLILTARVPRAATFAVPRTFRDIHVLFGDPRLDDEVKLTGRFNEDDLATVARLKEALKTLPDYAFHWADDHAGLMDMVRSDKRPAFVFNLCDEGYRNNAFHELHVPALLEMHDIPYTGAGPSCLGLCYNKGLIRGIAQSLDIPVPTETYTGPFDRLTTLPSSFPVLVKPNFGDSSVGITKDAVVHDREHLVEYTRWLREEFGRIGILVQEFLCGTEYSIGVIGNPGLTYHVQPALEVDYSQLPDDLPPILGYESKWDPQSPYWNSVRYRPAELDQESLRQMHDYANLLFERLGCRDYARFDFRRDTEGRIKLMEVNPNPGWCWDGKMNIMAGFEGWSYAQLLERIIQSAQERYALMP